jgi:hypothetical protein
VSIAALLNEIKTAEPKKAYVKGSPNSEVFELNIPLNGYKTISFTPIPEEGNEHFPLENDGDVWLVQPVVDFVVDNKYVMFPDGEAILHEDLGRFAVGENTEEMLSVLGITIKGNQTCPVCGQEEQFNNCQN